MDKLFAPQATVKVAATTSASTGQKMPGTRAGAGPYTARLFHDGAQVAHIAFGADTTVAATTSDFPWPGGQPAGITVPNPAKGNDVFFSVILDSTTANVYVTTGDGI